VQDWEVEGSYRLEKTVLSDGGEEEEVRRCDGDVNEAMLQI